MTKINIETKEKIKPKSNPKLLKTEIRIRLRNQKNINIYNQFLALLQSQTIQDNRKIKHSLNEVLEIHFTKFIEHYLLDEQFDSLEQKLFRVLQSTNKRSRNNTYTYVDQVLGDVFQMLLLNEKKVSFLINVLAEKLALPLETLNAPHEQMKNDLDWVRLQKKKLQNEFGVWCQNRKKDRKKYEN